MHTDHGRLRRARGVIRNPVTMLALGAVILMCVAQSGGAASSSAMRHSSQRAGSSKPAPGPYLALVQKLSGEIASHIGHALSLSLSVVINPTQELAANISAYAVVEDKTGGSTGDATQCVIHINPLLYKSKVVTDTNETVGHEVFHCFEAMDYPTITAFGRAPDWLTEGAAEWVGDTLEPAPDGWWRLYLGRIKTPLFSRAYDAIGFFAHMTDSGEDTWHLLDPMLKAGSSAAAYNVAADKTVRLTWASSLARQPSFGEGWDTTGPGIVARRYHPAITLLRTGTVVKGTVAPYTNGLIPFNPSADVVTVTTSTPYSRLHEANGPTVDGVTGSHQYCVNECSMCAQMSAMPRLAPGASWLAVTGDSAGATYTVTGGPATCGACLVGDWTVTSLTFDPGVTVYSGGAGTTVDIAANGTVVTDFTPGGALVSPTESVKFSGIETDHYGLPTDTKQLSGSFSATTITTAETITYGGAPPVAVQPGSTSGSYRCSGGDLTLSFPAGGKVLVYKMVPAPSSAPAAKP
jgi:hypothetical protein